MRISTDDQLLELLDGIVARSVALAGQQLGPEAGGLCGRAVAPPVLATDLPDEPLVDWHARGLLGELDGARVLDVGCGNGRNSRWFAEQGATVEGIDLAEPLLQLVRDRQPAGVTLTAVDVLRGPLPGGVFDVVYDSGCFHHVAPHRRPTYLRRVLPLVARGGAYGIVTLASEAGESAGDAEMIASGDGGGGTTFSLADLGEVFGALHPVEVRRVREGVQGTFGLAALNAALFRA